jgi:uncharacterized protein (TIGR03067 family)
MRTRAAILAALVFLGASDIAAVPVRPPTKDRPKDPMKEDIKKLEGTWEVVAMEYNGRQIPMELIQRRGLRLIIAKGKCIKETRLRDQVRQVQYTLKLDPAKKPKQIDFQREQTTAAIQAIYSLEGDRLIVCEPRIGAGRPSEFKAPMGSRVYLYTWKRVGP